jgi:hypothetical protein
MINYEFLREIEKKEYNVRMGFDYLPMNYEFMDRHQQNNKYMCAMWEQENDELENVIYQYCEYEKVQEK